MLTGCTASVDQEARAESARVASLPVRANAQPTSRPAEDLDLRLPPAPAKGYWVQFYRVEPGDTLWDIARRFGIDYRTLIVNNREIERPRWLQVGDTIRVVRPDGLLVASEGRTLDELAKTYGVEARLLQRINGVLPGQASPPEVFIPGLGRVQAAYEELARERNQLSWPVQGRITSRYGPRNWDGHVHQGVDIAASRGADVVAAASGRVLFAGWFGGYGKLIVIDHGNGTRTRYAHNAELLVKRGDRVERGQVIARVGSTGKSTGPHVHFEVVRDGTPQDPLAYLPP